MSYILFSSVLDIKKWLNEDNLDFRVSPDTHDPTALVSLALLIRSRENMTTWHGDLLGEPCLFEMLSRSNQKVYVIIEDLRQGVAFRTQFTDELQYHGFESCVPVGLAPGINDECVLTSTGRNY